MFYQTRHSERSEESISPRTPSREMDSSALPQNGEHKHNSPLKGESKSASDSVGVRTGATVNLPHQNSHAVLTPPQGGSWNAGWHDAKKRAFKERSYNSIFFLKTSSEVDVNQYVPDPIFKENTVSGLKLYSTSPSSKACLACSFESLSMYISKPFSTVTSKNFKKFIDIIVEYEPLHKAIGIYLNINYKKVLNQTFNKSKGITT